MTVVNKIVEFNPQIYPFRLWVAVNPKHEEVSSKFYGLTGQMERMEMPEFKNSLTNIATTTLVSDKKDGWMGCLVLIWKPKMLKVNQICHEASHCTDFVCEQFGISSRDFDNGEAYAYLIGWIAECINSVKENK